MIDLAEYVVAGKKYLELIDFLIEVASENIKDAEYALNLAHLVAHRDIARMIVEQVEVEL